MRRPTLLALLLLATACGSSDSVTNPPAPPPAPGIPAAAALVTGDGQTAAAGATLPVPLSVLVKDSDGNPVPSVVVHFSVDTGGGSLSSASATTNANGISSNISWTLGQSGSNVVSVTVATLAPVRFHALATSATAQTVFTSQTIGAGGGTITYTHAGDPLNGLSITVPAGAYTSGSSWTVVADPTIAVTLPTGFSLAGPPLVIGNGQGHAAGTMTLKVPLPINDQIATAPFYYDPATQLLEPIALVDRTATTATLATSHFSVDLLALPDANGASALRGASRGAFGNVVIVWVQTPLSQLVGTYTSGFAPGVDDWEFENNGDFIAPGGGCEGMSITAMYYWYTFRRGAHPNSGLFHRYDKSVANMIDNDQGIRYTGSVQGDYGLGIALGFDQEARLTRAAIANGASLPLLTSSWIALTIKLTHQPVLIGINSSRGGHAVIAYAVTVTPGALTTVRVADPNQPGNAGVTMNFTNGLFTPTNFSTRVGSVATAFNEATALNVSGDLPIPVIAARWAQFKAKQAGADRYPSGFTLEYQNKASGLWHTVTGNKLVLFDSNYNFRTHCPTCATTVENPVQAWDREGRSAIGYPPLTVNVLGTSSFWLEMQAENGNLGAGYISADSFQITWQKMTIDAPAETPLDTLLSFKAINPPGDPGVHYTYTWDFGDSTANVAKDDDPVAKHTYTVHGHYVVKVTVKVTGTAELIATASTQQEAAPKLSIIVSSMVLKDSLVTMHASPGEHGTRASVYTWTFGDGSAAVRVTGDSVVTHRFTTSGTFTIKVSLADPVTGSFGPAEASVLVETPRVTFVVGGLWDAQYAPPPGSYTFTSPNANSVRFHDASGIDVVFMAYNIGSDGDGLVLSMVLAPGEQVFLNESFTKTIVGVAPRPGQFGASLAPDQNHPINTILAPVGTGSLRIDAISQLSDGSWVAHFQFSLFNGTGGSVVGSGVTTWK